MKTATTEALKQALGEAQGHLRTLRSQLSAGQLTRVRQVRVLRQKIARLKTVLRQKSII